MQVPNMISTKDLSYLTDIFEWNFTASKKAYHFSTEVKIESIKEAAIEVAKMHTKMCQKIVQILGGYNG